MNKILYFDLETGGLSSEKNGILSISGIIEIDGVVKEKFNFFMKPSADKIIEDEALEINGITREQIETFESQDIIYNKFTYLLGQYVDKYDRNDKFKQVAYNISFDFDFLTQWASDNNDSYLGSLIDYKKQFDPFRLFQILKFEGIIEHDKSNKLIDACEYFGIELKDAHTSMGDTIATRELYYKLKEIIEGLK